MRFGALIQRFPALRRIALTTLKLRVPVVRQLASTDCGAAALAMALGYHGRYVQLNELRELLIPGRDGIRANSLLKIARLYGLRGRGVTVSADGLKNVPKGSILFWQFNHYVVFEKCNKKRIHIVDPAHGRRTITPDSFKRAFTGVVLILEPQEDFKLGAAHGKTSGLFGRILEEKSLLMRVIGAAFSLQALSTITPLLLGIVIDQVIPHKDVSLLLAITIGYCIFQVFTALSDFVRAHLLLHLRARLEASFTLAFLEHLVDLPYSFFQGHTAGDLMVRMNSNSTIREILTSTAMSAVVDGMMAVIYLAILAVLSPRLTVAVLALAALRILLLIVARSKQRQYLSETIDNLSQSQAFQIEMLSGIETLKAMGLERQASQRWADLFVTGLNISIKKSKLEAFFNAVLSLLGSITTLIFLFYGAYLVINEAFTLGMMMAFSALAAGFLGPLNSFVSSLLQLQMVEVYLDRIDDVMITPREREGRSVSLVNHVEGTINVDKVSFSYGVDEKPVLDQVSVEFSAGARIALVGRTGSGKSTLGRIIAGLYEPTNGRVLIDGKDISYLDLTSLRSHIGIVSQDIQLFGTSIRQNISLSNHRMALDQIVRAAKTACLHDEIMSMPMGYETLLSDRGLSLSGGQRQRLAIARALAADPRILILDEATSQLDTITEELINVNLASIRCTRIVIAHRLSTIRDADRIIVLDDGRIVEEGQHSALLAKGGFYTQLLHAQREHKAALSS
jgi:HlyB family type I secretion system ABC transporter